MMAPLVNEFYWINMEEARRDFRKISLTSWGAIMSILDAYYVRREKIPAIDDQRAAEVLAASESEWAQAKGELLESGMIAIQNGLIVPNVKWAKPESDS